jgi:hypothetical protein
MSLPQSDRPSITPIQDFQFRNIILLCLQYGYLTVLTAKWRLNVDINYKYNYSWLFSNRNRQLPTNTQTCNFLIPLLNLCTHRVSVTEFESSERANNSENLTRQQTRNSKASVFTLYIYNKEYTNS